MGRRPARRPSQPSQVRPLSQAEAIPPQRSMHSHAPPGRSPGAAFSWSVLACAAPGLRGPEPALARYRRCAMSPGGQESVAVDRAAATADETAEAEQHHGQPLPAGHPRAADRWRFPARRQLRGMAAFIASRARSIAEAHGPPSTARSASPQSRDAGGSARSFRGSQHRAHPDQRGLGFPDAHRREFFLLLALGVIQDHPLEFGEHAVELRAGHVHRLQDAEHPGGLSFPPGSGHRRPPPRRPGS